jgi:hypothetical protein
MASLIIDTGVESHPQIQIDSINLKNGTVEFKWIGGPYPGDCSEVFPISVSEHGSYTVDQVVSAITAHMVATLPQG